MSANCESIYNLITDLCITSTFSHDRYVIKRLRQKLYNILLFKNHQQDVVVMPDENPLAWHLLINDALKNTEDEDYRVCLQKLRESTDVDQYDLQRVLCFLFAMRNAAPKVKEPHKCKYSVNAYVDKPLLSFTHYDADDFVLTDVPICQSYKYSNSSFTLKKNISNGFADASNDRSSVHDDTGYLVSCRSMCTTNESSKDDTVRSDEPMDEALWDTVLKMNDVRPKSWETMGSYAADVEKSFLCECDGTESQIISYIETLNALDHFPSNEFVSKNELDYKEFVKDMKYLLVGIASDTFHKCKGNAFCIKPNVYFKDFSASALNKYLVYFLTCAANYTILNEFSNWNLLKYQLNGYIMQEYRLSIKRFLPFYRLAVFSISDEASLLTAHNHAKQLAVQIGPLASICEAVLSNNRAPDGVSLLNYLYRAVIYETNQDAVMVLYSAFHSCCQMYFSRFLRMWMFSGTLIDPYEEFFVNKNSKYASHQLRTFWSKCYTVNIDKVPDFLKEIKDQILLCGKSVNLLKLCMPNSPIWDASLEKYQTVTCSFDPEQIHSVDESMMEYSKASFALCQPQLKMCDVLAQSHLGVEYFEAISKKRLLALQRIELENVRTKEEKFAKKQYYEKLVKDVLDEQIYQKDKLNRANLAAERSLKRAEKKQNDLKNKEIVKEAEEIKTFYKGLMKTTDEKRKVITDKIEALKIMNALETDENISSTAVSKVDDLDLLNANATTVTTKEENDATARRNKIKVLKLELGNESYIEARPANRFTTPTSNANLTDLQRNRLKVLSSEFDININNANVLTTPTGYNENQTYLPKKTEFEINRDRNLHSFSFGKNRKKSDVDLLDAGEPMSIGTTPIDSYNFLTPNSTVSIFSAPSLDVYERSNSFTLVSPLREKSIECTLSDKQDISRMDVQGISNNNLKLFLQKSVTAPLFAQLNLINNELLKFFIVNREFFNHLENLKKYFFLLDGEFSRHLCDGLFTRLYQTRHPVEFINCRTLQSLIYKALDWSVQSVDKNVFLSFRVTEVPDCFNLSEPDVLSCLSLSYRVDWPLNILLPIETIAKYDKVFKYLIKLHHISWILQKTFQDLKVLIKESGMEKEVMRSPQYQRLQRFRHIMTHFMQTLQNYTSSEILQSWEQFLLNVKSVKTLDQLYTTHITYIKTIMFMCLLNQKSTPMRKVLHEIFVVILKFYRYLCSRQWIVENNVYVHPNFDKLVNIFKNFEEYVQYLFKLGQKVAKVGYQSEIIRLLDMLDVNNYYTKVNKDE